MTKTTFDALRAVIAQLTTPSDVREAFDLIRQQHHAVQRNTLRDAAQDWLRIGARVTFSARGAAVAGTITKINQRTVCVKADSGPPWRVSAGLLRPEAASANAPH